MRAFFVKTGQVLAALFAWTLRVAQGTWKHSSALVVRLVRWYRMSRARFITIAISCT